VGLGRGWDWLSIVPSDGLSYFCVVTLDSNTEDLFNNALSTEKSYVALDAVKKVLNILILKARGGK
jgi:hypothetical protein